LIIQQIGNSKLLGRDRDALLRAIKEVMGDKEHSTIFGKSLVKGIGVTVLGRLLTSFLGGRVGRRSRIEEGRIQHFLKGFLRKDPLRILDYWVKFLKGGQNFIIGGQIRKAKEGFSNLRNLVGKGIVKKGMWVSFNHFPKRVISVELHWGLGTIWD